MTLRSMTVTLAGVWRAVRPRRLPVSLTVSRFSRPLLRGATPLISTVVKDWSAWAGAAMAARAQHRAKGSSRRRGVFAPQ
jgi:hypothetical protein